MNKKALGTVVTDENAEPSGAADAFRVVILTIETATGQEHSQHYAAPNDGRPVEDLMLSELRPLAALDAMVALDAIVARANGKP